MISAAFAGDDHNERNYIMLSWALTFLVIALIAGLFGFGGVASVSVQMAQVLFFLFLVLFVVTAIFGYSRRGRGGPPVI